ncbi:hypothetical protein KY347_04020 [Candidatus Woesearchaeota archaeon]|nr:hypothetical protein [Candidatus Woesearchaeota archaeon]
MVIMTLTVFCSVSANAAFYPYGKQITITDSDSSPMGYVTPYEQEVLFKDYAYLKWKRNGYPEGNTFPIALVEGTTVPLPFGIEGKLLRVRVNSISGSGVDLTIDKSDVLTEIQNIPETLPGNINAIGNEIKKQVEEGLEQTDKAMQDLNAEITIFVNQFGQRVDKFINRGYHSSLHILNSNANSVEKRIDTLIKNKESEFAEKIADRIVPLLIDTFVAGTLSVTGILYTNVISQIPSSVRHEITQFIYNINTKFENSYSSDYMLSKSGVTTILIGNPSRNKFSSNLNDELKNLNLPYFKDGKIIGKRTYSEDSIGLVAAIPEEKQWLPNTLQNRWDNDKIRLYKTMIAGIGDNGLETAAKWYNDQLDNARSLITSVASLTDGADSTDILKIVSDNFNNNPKSTISSAALMQGWILTGLSSIQSTEFDKVDSLGYVAVVKKKGNSYDVLEIHTINGYKTNYFLNPYEEIEKIQDVVEEVTQLSEETPEIETEESPDKITGNVIEEVESKDDDSKKEIPIISWVVNIFRRWFG